VSEWNRLCQFWLLLSFLFFPHGPRGHPADGHTAGHGITWWIQLRLTKRGRASVGLWNRPSAEAKQTALSHCRDERRGATVGHGEVRKQRDGGISSMGENRSRRGSVANGRYRCGMEKASRRMERTCLVADGPHRMDRRVDQLQNDTPVHTSRQQLYLPPPRHYRNVFAIPKKIRRATLYASALGIFDAYVNGQRVSDAMFSPGWSDYRKRAYLPALRCHFPALAWGQCGGSDRGRRLV